MELPVNVTNNNYQLILDAGTAFVVRELAAVEKQALRKERKENVLDRLVQNINNLYISRVSKISPDNLESLISEKLTQDEAINFIIDLAFSDPFSPYELAYSEKHFNDALVTIGGFAGLTEEKVRKILETKRDAIRAHIRITDFKEIISWVARLIILVIGSILIAPFIGAAIIGLGTGIVGLSMINHILTMVGMHAFDPVSAGYLGGQMVVRSVGNLSASMIRGGGSNIYLESAVSARLELGKLQVSFNEVLLSDQKTDQDALALLQEIETNQVKLLDLLEVELTMNEKYSRRVRELENTNRSMSSAINWMKRKYDSYYQIQKPENF